MSTATLQPCPARLVPPPRITIGAPNLRQSSTVPTIASVERGITTPIGTWR